MRNMPHPMPDLIVFLPGIMGSVLEKDGHPIWGFGPGAITRALFTAGHSISNRLRLGGDDPERPYLDDGVMPTALLPDLHFIPGLWKIDGYGRVCDFIRSTFEVVEGKNFFTFPYDWRRDNRANARRLQAESREWLATWRLRYPDAKLILIAHSMGGLLSRYFLDVLGGWQDTRGLITFGTPYRGALTALDTLSNGVRKGPLDLSHITDFCRTCTSIYQLLPIYPSFDPGTGTMVRVAETSGIPGVDASMAIAALKFHQEIMAAVDKNLNDPKYVANRYRLYPIAGNLQDTLQSARLEQGRVTLRSDYQGENLSGDGTVPRVSAFPHEQQDASQGTFAAAKHGSLQNTNQLLLQLEAILTGFYIDLGHFLEPDRRVPLTFTLEDVFFTDEKVRIGVFAGDEDRIQLTARIFPSGSDTEVGSYPIQNLRNGKYGAECPVLKEGSYRVQVEGDTVVPIADSFGVTERIS